VTVDAEARQAPALPSETPAGRARLAALAAIADVRVTPTSLISYRSRGHLLIIGPARYALEQAESLRDRLQCVVLATDAAATSPHPQGDVPVVRADRVTISGHLGAFSVSASRDGNAVDLGPHRGPGARGFDLVLDLSRPPLIGAELPPPGYFAPDTDKEALYRAVQEIPGMVGEFEKPKYFHYDSAICAHGERGIAGCTRCLDVCPSGAITSIGERVAVDAHLCHGVGICSAVCPTGAIRYAYPKPSETIDRLRKLIRVFAAESGSRAVLLFHDAEGGLAQVERIAARMPERVIPVQVEDIGAIGLDVWLCALAHGAGAVCLLASEETPSAALEALSQHVDIARRVLGRARLSARWRAVAARRRRGARADRVRGRGHR